MSLALLDTGIYAWLADDPRHGRPNAGVVIDADGITVVDTLCTPAQAAPLVDAVTALGPPVKRVVLTSSHVEFAGGTSQFRFAAVFGRAQASAHLDQPADPVILRRLLPEQAAEFDDEFATRPVSHVVDGPVQLTPACAAIPLAGEEQENLVVVLAAAGIVFAGALCAFGVTPLAWQGDPDRWADALDELIELAPVVVPGHGPVGGEEEVRDLQGYLRACAAAAGDPARIPPGPWDAWPGREHDVVNVERAAMLARGDDAVPPTLLARLGLSLDLEADAAGLRVGLDEADRDLGAELHLCVAEPGEHGRLVDLDDRAAIVDVGDRGRERLADAVAQHHRLGEVDDRRRHVALALAWRRP